jgi:hypothetical protein
MPQTLIIPAVRGSPANQYEKDGERTWALVEFTSKQAHEKFQVCMLGALDACLEKALE